MNLKKINNPFNGKIFYKESTSSTMADAKSVLAQSDTHGSIFLAGYQTQGIGRIPGRVWESKAQENLMFTLVLDKDVIGHGYTTIPLKAGLALSLTINEFSKEKAYVKWPNDVLVGDKKISGILCHSNRQTILVGVGLNVNQLEFSKELKDKSTSLSLITGNGFSLEMVLTRFLANFLDVMNNTNWLELLNQNLYKNNQDVIFYVGDPSKNERVNGTLRGLDSTGKILIEDNSGDIKGFLSGELNF